VDFRDLGPQFCLRHWHGDHDRHCADRVMRQTPAERRSKIAVDAAAIGTAALRCAAFLVLGVALFDGAVGHSAYDRLSDQSASARLASTAVH
jgi:hypothetical protein